MRIDLPDASIDALRELADRERRDLRDQAEHLLILALHRRGLVSRDGLERKGGRGPAEPERRAETVAVSAPKQLAPARLERTAWN
jgi:hypothetical protein